MKKHLLLMLLCGVSMCASAQDAEYKRFEAYLDGLVSAQFSDYKLAGMTLAMVKDGEVVLTGGYGYAHLADLTPVDPETHLFRPGSVSKLFTWTAVMQLVEQGRLDLQADVGQYALGDQVQIDFCGATFNGVGFGAQPGAHSFCFGLREAFSFPAQTPVAEHLDQHLFPVLVLIGRG